VQAAGTHIERLKRNIRCMLPLRLDSKRTSTRAPENSRPDSKRTSTRAPEKSSQRRIFDVCSLGYLILSERVRELQKTVDSILSERVRELQKTVASQVDVALESLDVCSCGLHSHTYS
jgi:hypothetical protein